MKIYAYKNEPHVLKSSSSGGAFSRVVSEIVHKLDEEYAIYGAAWNDQLVVKHARIDNIEDISMFYGSKYSRSDIYGIYEQVEKDIISGRYVIFSGTPCQISGILKFIDNRNLSKDKIFTIDIICHGSPKPVVWKDCKEWLERKYKHRITKVSFRDKSVGWKRYPTSIELDNKKVIKWTYRTQIYIRMFLSLLILEKGCFSCRFSKMERISDITLGDFWGINEIINDIDKTGGVSLVLANTPNGVRICESIKKNQKKNEIIREYKGDNNLIKKYQHNLRRPTDKPQRYEEFWEDYKTLSFSELIKKYKFITLKGKIRFYIKTLLIKLRYFDEKLS